MRCWLPILTVLVTSLTIIPQNTSAASCTISKYNANDIRNAQNDCSQIVINNIEVAAGETLDLTHLKQGTKVIFQGTITWAYKEWSGPLLSVAGTNIEITGASGHVLDGRGSLWWDGLGTNGGKTKPQFFRVKLTNSNIDNINIKNSPVHIFSISNCDNLVIQQINIDNSAGDSGGGHNTDAFDVGNSNAITIKHSTVYNQDDCLAINSGTNIVFADNYCSGGHGISIGSVGGRDNNVVKGVQVYRCEVANSDNGIRIKTVYGATGSVSDVSYEDITLTGIHRYGIIIEGDYENGSPTGTPTGGVPVTDLTVKNVHGTVDSSGANVYILVQNAANWYFSGISVTGGSKTMACTGIPSGAGISC
ncbi:polygalacturonase-like [Anoplophora glabripennis]|uniref:polygalacturonase-like n=1 Tax=Anoplophora glabripennis TaxID=217634 RepID=UPI000873ABE9|nr:polygalacturonase-like [Anoplophora glabripennis]